MPNRKSLTGILARKKIGILNIFAPAEANKFKFVIQLGLGSTRTNTRTIRAYGQSSIPKPHVSFALLSNTYAQFLCGS